MATYAKERVNFENILDYLVSLDTRLVKVDAGTINVNNKFTINIPTTVVSWPEITITVSGEDYSAGGTFWQAQDVFTVIDDNFIFITIGLDNTQNSACIVYITDNDGLDLAGCVADNKSANACAFYNCNNSNVGYSLPSLIPFTAPAGQIAWSDKAPVSNNGSFLAFVEGLYSCSSVTPQSSINFTDGDNYIAVGAHTMAKITA